MIEFEQAVIRLDRFIWYKAHQFSSALSGMEAADLHQEGLIKLYEMCVDCPYHGLENKEWDQLFKLILRNRFVDLCRTDKASMWHRINSIEVNLEMISNSMGQDGFEEIYLRHYQEHINKIVSANAAILLEHFLNPTPAVYHMHNIQNMRRRALQSQGFNVRVSKRVTHEIVGKTLGFSVNRTKILIRELQQAWRTIMMVPA